MEIYHIIMIGFPVITAMLVWSRKKEIKRERRERNGRFTQFRKT